MNAWLGWAGLGLAGVRSVPSPFQFGSYVCMQFVVAFSSSPPSLAFSLFWLSPNTLSLFCLFRTGPGLDWTGPGRRISEQYFAFGGRGFRGFLAWLFVDMYHT
ncbi:hypothetical protein HDK90DRAFT_473512, partial [Phyllosticta capitalensis]